MTDKVKLILFPNGDLLARGPCPPMRLPTPIEAYRGEYRVAQAAYNVRRGRVIRDARDEDFDAIREFTTFEKLEE